MNNLDLNKMSENEIIEYCRPIVRKIIQKHFKNHLKFSKTHLLSFEELEQFGMIGVLEGIRTFDETRGTKLSTYLFARIISAINRNAKKASLRNMNNTTFDLVHVTSLNSRMTMWDNASEEWLNLIPSDVDDYETLENNVMIEMVIKTLLNDSEIPKEYIAFLKYRLEGYTILKISKIFKTSHYHVRKILKKFETKAAEVLKLEVR